ncbi:LytR/AlgR family response regulator transcription factor [Xanthomonas sacchari]|uniref:LytR/AlgR family response regulator transcription factor n=1 Tax=Xanthomonas sacchari TaxID=56458 RepID=UPI0035299F6D
MTEPAPIRTLLVEDVALGAEKLARLVEAHPPFRVAACAATLEEALHLAAAQRFDLVLLDIGLPDGSGLDFLARLPAPAPYVVFVTAHPQHALRSYELGALDYVLKPVDRERLDLALERVRQRLRPAVQAAQAPLLSVRNGLRTDYVAAADIDYIDSAGHYACVHVGRATHLLRDSIGQLAERLASAGLLRVHRSVIVNLDRVRTLHERSNGDADLQLLDGKVLPVSRTFRAPLDARLRMRCLRD